MKARTYGIIAIIIIAAAIAAYFISGANNTPGKYDNFAKCLSANGVKMYGTFWCTHCKAQKEAFGSSWQYMTYIECSTPDGSSQTQICKQAGITSYPTWEFGSGRRIEGQLDFMALSQYSNCTI